jgi:hypothetical protein
MAEKNWVDPRLFCEAFRVALDFHGVELNDAAVDAACARAIATHDYIRLHTAACRRVAEREDIGTKVGRSRIYTMEGLHRIFVLANAELAAAGIQPPPSLGDER